MFLCMFLRFTLSTCKDYEYPQKDYVYTPQIEIVAYFPYNTRKNLLSIGEKMYLILIGVLLDWEFTYVHG